MLASVWCLTLSLPSECYVGARKKKDDSKLAVGIGFHFMVADGDGRAFDRMFVKNER